MTKQVKSTSRAPDLEDPFDLIIRLTIASMISGLATYGVVAIGYAIFSSWGDPYNYNLAMIGGVMAALLAYSIMSIREGLEASRFMVYV